MIRSNGFALFTGRDASERLRDSTGKIGRFHDRVLVNTGDGFGELGADTRRSESAMVSLSVGENDGSLPLVHGFEREERGIDEELPVGEFAVLDRTDDGYLLARDVLGTRPLFYSDGAVASDHRFLSPTCGTLLDPGTVYSLSDGLRPVRERRLRPRRSTETLPEASERLSDLLVGSVSDCVSGCRRVAVSFSGGLDSAIVAFLASRIADVVLCSVHTKGSRDERTSERAADLLDLELRSASLGEVEVADELRSLDVPFQPSAMDKALWCIFSRTARLARENGAELMLLGQLADELFGGYFKYAEELERNGALAAAGLMRSDVLACSSRAFIRDEAACGTWIEPRFPFANEEVARFGLGLPVEYKISGGTRKVILRDAASRLGLPEQLTQSPKKAAQYSSGVLKQIGKLSFV